MDIEERIKLIKQNYDEDKLVLEFDLEHVDVYLEKMEYGKEILSTNIYELIALFFPKAYEKWRKEEDLKDGEILNKLDTLRIIEAM